MIVNELRRMCGHDSRSVEGCTTCEAADEIERLRRDGFDSRHPAAQNLLGRNARLSIALDIVRDILADDCEPTPITAEHWAPIHDQVQSVIRKRNELREEVERLRADRDDVRAELTNLQIAFNDWKVTHSTVRLEVEIERLREFERSAALTLPGVYYMDPPDGGDVSLLKQLQRSSIDAARYRWLRERAPFWAWQPDSNCYPGITVGFSHSETKYCDYTLDEAIDAAMGEEKRE